MQIQLRNNSFTLLPQKALFWENQKCLLISDLHIGKISHFRREGIAIPAGGSGENFKRLDSLLEKYPIKRILYVGDLFHSSLNKEWDTFCLWRNKHKHIEMDIILGNHDRFHPSIYQEADLQVLHDNYSLDGFTFCHEPRAVKNENEYLISGHIHPAIRLSGKANQRLRFPCFYFGKNQALLPSFGYFTGSYIIQPKPNEQVIAIVNDSLIRVN